MFFDQMVEHLGSLPSSLPEEKEGDAPKKVAMMTAICVEDTIVDTSKKPAFYTMSSLRTASTDWHSLLHHFPHLFVQRKIGVAMRNVVPAESMPDFHKALKTIHKDPKKYSKPISSYLT